MPSEHRNVEPEQIGDATVREQATALWNSDIAETRSLAIALLASANRLGHCVVFDVYSRANLSGGAWLLPAFGGLWPQLLDAARRIIDEIWAAPHETAPLRDERLASAMHVIWRTLEPDDASTVLRCLRTEAHWRVLYPAINAADLMRGEDADFDAAVAPLLEAIADREDLEALVRHTALHALSRPFTDELQRLVALMHRLPLPASALCAQLLLNGFGDRFDEAVRHVADSWGPAADPLAVQVRRTLARR